jgi:hypothetical protein
MVTKGSTVMENKVSEYIRTIFSESRDGKLTIDIDEGPRCYLVDRDKATAVETARQCCKLFTQLTELGKHLCELDSGNVTLSDEWMGVWTAYVRHSDDGGLDTDELVNIGKNRRTGGAFGPTRGTLV